MPVRQRRPAQPIYPAQIVNTRLEEPYRGTCGQCFQRKDLVVQREVTMIGNGRSVRMLCATCYRETRTNASS